MQAAILYNPMAGRFPSLPLVERAADIFRQQDWEIRLLRTEKEEQLLDYSRQAVEQGLDAVLIAGGDGSLNKAASALQGSSTALGVLPAGTANVWAQEIGLPTLSWTNWTALERSARLMASARVKTVDIGEVNGRPFLLWAGVGLDAFVVHHLEPRTRWEKQFAELQYAANAALVATRWEGMQLEAWADEQYIQGTYVLALATNVALYAGGLARISPGAKMDDGQMDFWLFSGDTLAETLQHIWRLVSGKHLDSKQVKGLGCEKVRIKSGSDLFLQVDGEPVKSQQEISIAICPQALQVLIPEGKASHLFCEDQP